MLPNTGDLYKSHFPSWKMLEDAISPHPTLRHNILEVKEDIEMVYGP